MNSRSLLYMTIAVVAAVVVIIVLNLVNAFKPANEDAYVQRTSVRTIAVVHNQKPYILNFEQQNQMIEFLNASRPTDIKKVDQKADFENMVLTLFNGKEITVTPVGYDKDYGLVFTVEEWDANSNLKDPSKGQMKKLIGQAHD